MAIIPFRVSYPHDVDILLQPATPFLEGSPYYQQQYRLVWVHGEEFAHNYKFEMYIIEIAIFFLFAISHCINVKKWSMQFWFPVCRIILTTTMLYHPALLCTHYLELFFFAVSFSGRSYKYIVIISKYSTLDSKCKWCAHSLVQTITSYLNYNNRPLLLQLQMQFFFFGNYFT